MPARILFCRWPGCGRQILTQTSAAPPSTCPGCQKAQLWSTEPPGVMFISEVTENDRRFLKGLNIVWTEDAATEGPA